VCALVVLLVLVVVQCVRAGGNSGLSGVVRHVEEAIRKEMMIEPVRYSDPNLTMPYHASPQFNARGMGNLYKVTNFFMDIIQREDPYPEGKSFCCFVDVHVSLHSQGRDAGWCPVVTAFAGARRWLVSGCHCIRRGQTMSGVRLSLHLKGPDAGSCPVVTAP
jgi:hypothetical protein